MLFVRFFGWYENKIDIFLVMEYIENGDLSQYLKESPKRVKAEARNIVRQILEGLVVMHDQNICHRDLKPQVRPPPANIYRFTYATDVN
jgi:serine/threonine protein kinase